MDEQKNRNKTIAEHIFNGSTTMAGVCVTVIALFHAMKAGLSTYADEILAANTCIFITSCILSYASLRKEKNNRIEKFADILFFTGLLIMMIVGIIIVYSAY